MEWKPDKSLQVPVYIQISNYFETRILNGEYPSGSSLPSERALASQLDVNRSTIVSAYDQLSSLGIVTRIKGFGTVVTLHHSEEGNVKRVPNWEEYVKGGMRQLNDPITRQIHKIVGTDKPYINFAIGELSPDLFPVKLMQEAHSQLELSQYLGYEHIQGNLRLRETISDHLRQYRNIPSTASSVLVTSGAQQALQLIIQCLLQPGDAIAIEDPSYFYSLPIFHSAGLRTYRLPIEQEGIDPEQIVSLYKEHRIKMVFVSPIYHNPTGTTLSFERRKRLLEISTKYGIGIVEDDPYSLTSYDHSPVSTLKSMDQDGSVLYVSSLSKIVSSGLRIGWITGPQSVIQRLTDAKQQLDFGHSNIPQWIASQLLSSKELDNHLTKLRIGLKVKLELTVNALRAELGDDVRFQAPLGGIHLWCELPGDWNELRLFNKAIDNGVVFTPGSTLGSQPGHVRLTFSKVDDHLIAPGIRKFAEAFRSLRSVNASR
ncbi:PLP-dependent aminotransferase family protein [Cohnella mopanensis]|uniref:MocR-like pyridoxine biosynthesis transcription factor PdxR n=1 Tax=Cohnella mopanensis TaxID=2911966 RepID=UPI001EF93373|nr:PLP-dependent aminotransferase family protein [Cohnella mopanensis]